MQALDVTGVSKYFGATVALRDINLSIEEGEIHALVGENGSGKSTLVKILAGYHTPEPGGELYLDGERIGFPLVPVWGEKRGLGFVHQDLGLVPSLTVWENLRIGSLSRPTARRFSPRAERRAATTTLRRYGLSVDHEAKISSLSRVERAIIAIARASEDVAPKNRAAAEGILILDEVSAFLPAEERDSLFTLVRTLTRRGGTVLYIAHDLQEVLDLADRITVIRDGRIVTTTAASDINIQDLVRLLLGGPGLPEPMTPRIRSQSSARANGNAPSDVADNGGSVQIVGLSADALRCVSMSIDAGEIVGLTGVIGSGFDDVAYALVGANKAQSGTLRVGGKVLQLSETTPSRALSLGVVLIPADRLGAGGAATLSLEENVMLPVLEQYSGVRARRRMFDAAKERLDDLRVRPADPKATFGSLSGGNQQKVVMTKWLQVRPRLLLLHEPTQGVDVGTRGEILSRIHAAASSGAAVVCASIDAEQLAGLCDRVLVFSGGGVATELSGDAVTEAAILDATLRASTVNHSAWSHRDDPTAFAGDA